MKCYKKFAAAVFACMLAFSFFLAPASTVNAYTIGRGTLNVYSTYAYAATNDVGFVDVGLNINFIDYSNGQIYYRGETNQSENGFVDIRVSVGYYNQEITYAVSYHGNGSNTMGISWDPLNGYTPIIH